MTMIKYLTGVLAAGMMVTGALAQDFGPQPADYRYAVEDYVMSRLADSRGARVSVDSRPYPVYADFGRHGEIAAWAVDISVRTHVRSRRHDGYMHYTVIFVDGEPVAFEDDIRGVEAVRSSRYARR